MRPVLSLGILGAVVLPAVLNARPAPQDTMPEPTAAEVQQEASAVVAKLNQALLEAMQRGKELGYPGRYRLLEPVVKEVYDFESISRYVLSSDWEKLSAEEKQAFIQKMTEFGIAAYAAEFKEYAGEKFKILAEEPFRARLKVVKALLEDPKGENVQFVYILKPTSAGWKIVDVRYDGVSDLALKRAQFSGILAKEGFKALLAKLDEKIANYAQGKGKEKS